MRKNQYKDDYCENYNDAIKVCGRRLRFVVCVSALLACTVFLCGCTRREQLVLDSEGTVQTGEPAVEQADEATEESMQKNEAAEESMQADEASKESIQKDEEQTICVHVCGAVKKPAVYELPVGSRVYEAVAKAGGFTEDADESYVNQAQALADGVKLVIPTRQQTSKMEASGETEAPIGIVEAEEGVNVSENGGSGKFAEADGGQTSASDGKIDINTASEAELCGIPGIGATRAAAIVAYRQERGNFTSIEEIMNVSGIKEGTYAKIKDRIKVN